MHNYDPEGRHQANSSGCGWGGKSWKVCADFACRSHDLKFLSAICWSLGVGTPTASTASFLRRLLAIMGPSGGGKTSLLNALAGQVPETKGALSPAD